MRTKENQVRHDQGVVFWAGDLIKNGWATVLSDLPGNKKPPQIGGYIPDVYGCHLNEEIVIEVETTDSIESEHTKSQCSMFHLWKNQSPSRRFLIKTV